MSDVYEAVYNPDVLECIANLSNDEVFTPPEVANAMLDLLPQELFSDPNTKFLDPACKSGVFLREIAKRLLTGLEDKIPDLQERVDHIFKNQIYGIAITELTSLLSRRSVYCCKYADNKYSVTKFNDLQGNIFFSEAKHLWINGKCLHCGIGQQSFEEQFADKEEKHAYQFIHNAIPGDLENMKFDVIIGNPPYQLNVGNEGGNSSKAKAIYHMFISQAKKLNPRFLIMITPSRWMTRSTEGISDEWIDEMLGENKFITIHDFETSEECFPGVDIMGGVNYFLWAKDYYGECEYFFHDFNNEIKRRIGYLDENKSGVVIRNPEVYGILNKIVKKEGLYFKNMDDNFSGFVSPKDFFTNKQKLTSSWKDYSDEKTENNNIKYYINKNIHKKEFAWISKSDVPKHNDSVFLNKVLIPAANGSLDIVLGNPFFAEKNSACSQTYLVIGYNPMKHNLSEEQCKNIIQYIKTKFFRYLVSIKKKTQNGPRDVYQFVPLQDFSKPWADAELYQKYELTQEEIDFIESMIRPME